MTQIREFTYPSSDGKTLIHAYRLDPLSAPRAVFQIAHGVAEYALRYESFMRFLSERGFVVVANDHLGHGKSVQSEQNLGWFCETDGWEKVVDDIKSLHDQMKAEFPDLPYILFGHSMGSFVARTYLIRYPEDLTAAIICGTGQQSAALVRAGKSMAGMICKRKGGKHRSEFLNNMAFGAYNKGFEGRTTHDWLTKDQTVVDAYVADPLCGFTPSAELFYEMMRGIRFIGKAENIAKMRKDLPIFLIAGAKDPVGECGKGPKKVYDLYRAAGIRDVEWKLYENDRHELLNELDRETVMNDILAFIEKCI